MKIGDLKNKITDYLKDFNEYRALLLQLNNATNGVVQKLVYQKTTDSFKAKLNKEYGLLEKYIKKLGRNFSMRDGVYSEQYDIYDNALSNDSALS